jgi:hypothetical protein
MFIKWTFVFCFFRSFFIGNPKNQKKNSNEFTHAFALYTDDDLPDRNCDKCVQCCVDYEGWLQFQNCLYKVNWILYIFGLVGGSNTCIKFYCFVIFILFFMICYDLLRLRVLILDRTGKGYIGMLT